MNFHTLLSIIIESRLNLCQLSPVKRCNVRRQNFACGRVPCNIWAGSYVDRGHRWDENLNFKTLRWVCVCVHCAVLLWARWPVGRLLPAAKQPHPDGFHVTQIEPRSGETFSKQAVAATAC